MKFLIGKREDFTRFVDSIKSEDRVGIISHIDLDGLGAALILEKILESKGIKVDFVDFLEYQDGMFEETFEKLKEKEITKVFLTDLNVDISQEQGFNYLRENFDVLFIDHHPFAEDLVGEKNIIKSETFDCVVSVLYEFAKDYIDVKDLDWFYYPTLVAEWSFRKKEYMDKLEKKYPGITPETLFEFECGEIADKINSVLIYYKGNLKEAYELLKKKDFKSFDEIHGLVEAEIDKVIEKYRKEAEFYPDKNIYFYYYNPKFEITSTVATILSKDKGIYLFANNLNSNRIKISARNNTTDENVGVLLRKGIDGLQNATGGGHPRAAAATIRREDLEKFKENLLRG